MRKPISEKEVRLLFLQSGNACAFRGCGRSLIEPGTAQDDATVVGDIAHIVADSRQGPRGEDALGEEERGKHTNLILLCKEHHKVIDSQPRTYSVAVLRQMKADHEARVERVLAPPRPMPKPELRRETIHSTLMRVTHLPEAVFSAPCGFGEGEDDQVKTRINYPKSRDELVPFLLREGRLFAFQDLRLKGNPFAPVINRNRVEKRRAVELWAEAEGKRRYVTLLNRSLYKFTARLGVRYDPDHYRFYFPVEEFGKERVVTYRPLNASKSERKVAWQPKSRSTGEGKNFWWHLAAGLRFQQMADLQWCLSIRPERHLTSDSETPLPPEQIGRRVTRVKAKMYNDLYLGEVVFWRDYLSQGQPRFILNFGSQTAVIDVQLVTFDVDWAGIPGDEKPFKNQAYQEDLFTLSEREQAIAGEQLDWDELEEEDEEDYDDEY